MLDSSGLKRSTKAKRLWCVRSYRTGKLKTGDSSLPFRLASAASPEDTDHTTRVILVPSILFPGHQALLIKDEILSVTLKSCGRIVSSGASIDDDCGTVSIVRSDLQNTRWHY